MKVFMAELPFPRIALSYDRLNSILSMGVHSLWKRRLVREMLRMKPNPKCILDIATGTGEIADRFSRVTSPETEVIGLDPCREMIEVGKSKGRKARWIVAGSEALPLPDESVDILTCAFGVRNFRDRSQAFREWHRVLKPRAVVGVIEIHPIPPVWYRGLLSWYWHKVMPRIGGWLADGAAYQYLRDSSAQFLTPSALGAEVTRAGLRVKEVRSLFGSGMVSFSLFDRP